MELGAALSARCGESERAMLGAREDRDQFEIGVALRVGVWNSRPFLDGGIRRAGGMVILLGGEDVLTATVEIRPSQ